MKLFVAVKSLNTVSTSRARTQTEKRVAGAVTLLTLLLLLTACGGGGGGGGGGGSSTTPSVTLSANPASVAANETATLTWSSSNVTSCTASGAWSGSRPTAGSEPVGPLSTTSTFELSCNGGSGPATASTTVTVGPPPPDTTPPSVVSIAPADGSKVLVSTLIHVVFSEDVDPSTINEVSFQLTGPGGPVAGSRSYANRIATFTPAAALQSDKSYTASVTSAVKDLAGNALAQGVTSTFTTFTGTPLTSACASVYTAGFKLVSGFDNTPVPTLAKPSKGPGITEPTYKTCLVRVTDYAAEGLAGFARNDYSRRQAFNADNTKLIIYAGDGTWHLYDATTYTHIKELPGVGGDAEPQWHPTNSKILYYIPNSGIGMTLYQLNVDTGVSQVVADFGARLKNIWPAAKAAWTGAEGSPSRLLTSNADHPRYWAFMADDLDQNFGHTTLGLFTYDLEKGEIIGTYDLASHGKGTNGGPDHISMSPSGSYVVVSWYSADGGPVAYQRDFTSPVSVDSGSNHSDLVFGENGEEYYVAIDFWGDTGKLFMTNLATGVRTDLFDTYLNGTDTSAHFSGKAYDRPGWLLMSTYSDDWGSNRQWLHYKVFAVQLKANPVILQLAHHHSTFGGAGRTGTDYWSEPQASVNRDFTRVIFNSNWGATSYNDVDAYLIELPADAIAAP